MTHQQTFLFLFILLACLIGCNEDPSIVGVGVLPKTDYSAPLTDTIYATSHATEQNVLFTGYVDRVMLGNAADCEAWMLLKFNTWPDSMIGVYVTSATISMKTMYHFGDSTGMLSFDLYNVKSDWTGDSLANKDSLFNYSSNYFDNSTFIGSLMLASLDDSSRVSFDIPQSDTAKLTQWFTIGSDTNGSNYGLLLKPTNNAMIKGFYSFYGTSADSEVVYPELIVHYKNFNGDTGTYVHAIGVAKYLAHADAALQYKFSNPSDSLSYVQNGISYRSSFHFDTLKTLRHGLLPSTVLVNRAVIEVTLNSSSSLFNLNRTYLADSLYAYVALTDSTLNSSIVTLSQTYTNAQNQHVYQVKVNSFVQAWLKNPAMIKKISVAGVNESLSFDRFALYGNNAALVSERPRLIIIYSTSK